MIKTKSSEDTLVTEVDIINLEIKKNSEEDIKAQDKVSIKSIEKKEINNENYGINLSKRKFLLVIVALILSLAMASLDISIVATALPVISEQFNSYDNYTWIVTAYLLSNTSSQPIYGKLADIFGRKPIIMFALIVFTVSSALCGASSDILMLIIGRALQGIGAGGIMTMVNVIISDIVPIKDRGTYMGIVGAVFAFASVIGPLVGGFLTDNFSWRWAFYINVPVCVIAIIIVILFINIPTPKGTIMEKVKRIDYFGTISLVFSIISLLLFLNWGGSEFKWTSPIIIVLMCLFILFLIIFIVIELKFAKEPITPPKLFAKRNVALGCLENVAIGFGLIALNNTIALLYQNARGFSATVSGLRVIPTSITISIGSIGSGVLIGKFGHLEKYIKFGTLLYVIGCFLVTFIGIDTSYAYEILAYSIFGLGIGLNLQNNVVLCQISSPEEFLAIVTTICQFSLNIGGVIGVAVFGTILKNKFPSMYLNEYPNTNPDIVSTNDIHSLVDSVRIYAKSIEFSYRTSIFPIAIVSVVLALFIKRVIFSPEKPVENEEMEKIKIESETNVDEKEKEIIPTKEEEVKIEIKI